MSEKSFNFGLSFPHLCLLDREDVVLCDITYNISLKLFCLLTKTWQVKIPKVKDDCKIVSIKPPNPEGTQISVRSSKNLILQFVLVNAALI